MISMPASAASACFSWMSGVATAPTPIPIGGGMTCGRQVLIASPSRSSRTMSRNIRAAASARAKATERCVRLVATDCVPKPTASASPAKAHQRPVFRSLETARSSPSPRGETSFSATTARAEAISGTTSSAGEKTAVAESMPAIRANTASTLTGR